MATHAGKLNELGSKMFDDHMNTVESLQDALINLAELSKRIDVNGIEMGNLESLMEGLSKVDVSKYPTIAPEIIWDIITSTKATNDEYTVLFQTINKARAADREVIITQFKTDHKIA